MSPPKHSGPTRTIRPDWAAADGEHTKVEHWESRVDQNCPFAEK